MLKCHEKSSETITHFDFTIYLQISLLKIKGIGEAKIKKLLLYFGEFEKIKTASYDELKSVLNEKDAQTISEYFKDFKD